MTPKNLLSIYIPTSNRANYLKYCLDNVIKEVQKYSLRIFISDNYSIDSTKLVVSEYQKKYEHITYYKQEIQISLDANQLYFLKMVDTKFCLMVADDDGIEPDGITKILNILEQYPSTDLILLNANHYTTDMITLKYHNFNIKEDIILNNPRILLKEHFFFMHFSTLVVDIKQAKLINTLKYQKTYHAYCGLVFEYLYRKYLQNDTPNVFIASEPIIKLRDGYKTYSKEMIDVYYKRFPSFFTLLPDFYVMESKLKMKQLSKNNTKLIFLIRQRIQHILNWKNCKETYEYLSFFQGLKVLLVSLVPNVTFNFLVFIYKTLKRLTIGLKP